MERLLAVCDGGIAPHPAAPSPRLWDRNANASCLWASCPIVRFQSEPRTDFHLLGGDLPRVDRAERLYDSRSTVLTSDAADADVQAIRNQAGSGVTFSGPAAREPRGDRRICFFCAVCLWFPGGNALISVFNIVNSISMSVSARLRQYGAMRAIGMSMQHHAMVAAEAAAAGPVSGRVWWAFH